MTDPLEAIYAGLAAERFRPVPRREPRAQTAEQAEALRLIHDADETEDGEEVA